MYRIRSCGQPTRGGLPAWGLGVGLTLTRRTEHGNELWGSIKRWEVLE
jgi:hypothetical protein